MARKKTRKTSAPTTELANLDATVKKLTSLLSHPDYQLWAYSGAASGVRKKLLSIDYKVLRNVVQRVPLINAVINTRVDQILPYCKLARERDEKGFQIVPVDPKDSDEKEIEQLETFFEQTGFLYNEEREDDLMDYMQMLVRETLEIDQIATELQYNRRGDVIAFWALDGASIARADPERGDFKANTSFVQVVDDRVYMEYTHQNMLFDYKNKRADLRYRGYGYSAVEQAIDLITTLLFGYTHMRDQFVRDKVPKGFISIMGDADQEQLDAVRRYWYHAMNGAGGQWNIPILPSGKEGVGLEFKSLGQNNKDMEYYKLMMFVSSVIGAVFSIDMAELGIKTDNSQALIGENSAPRLQSSKDRGLASLLAFAQQHLNKVLRKVTTKYTLRFAGYEVEDESRRAEIEQKELKTRRTINELRKERGDDPIEDDYADVVLNEQAVQIYMASKQQEQAEQQQQEAGGEEEDNYSEEDDQEKEPDEYGENEDLSDLFKSLTDKKVLEFTIE